VTVPPIVRAALVAAAVAAAIVLVAWQRSEDRCTEAVKATLFALEDRVRGPQLHATIAGVETDCPGSSRLVDAGGVLFSEGHPRLATDVLREAVDREPDSFSAWAVLASVLAGADPAGSSGAAARAKSLNPFYRPPSSD